jgi:hypothetical protein
MAAFNSSLILARSGDAEGEGEGEVELHRSLAAAAGLLRQRGQMDRFERTRRLEVRVEVISMGGGIGFVGMSSC